MSKSQDKRIAVEQSSQWRATLMGNQYVIETASGQHVTDYVTTKQQADLIAAAPDLLEACKPVIREAKERADYMHDSWNEDAHVELTLTIKEIRAIHAAIALATKGRES